MVTGSLLHQVFQGVLVKWVESRKRSRSEGGVTKNDVDKIVTTVLSTRDRGSLSNVS